MDGRCSTLVSEVGKSQHNPMYPQVVSGLKNDEALRATRIGFQKDTERASIDLNLRAIFLQVI